MINYLLTYLTLDLNMVLALVFGVAIVGQRLNRKPLLALRLFGCLSASVPWSVLFQYLQNNSFGAPYFPLIVMLKYVCIFMIAILLTLLCFKCEVFTAVFCVTVAYCMEHIGSRVSEIISILLPAPWISDEIWKTVVSRLILYTALAAVFCILYFTLVRHCLCDEDDTMIDNRSLLLLAFIVVCIDIVTSTLMSGKMMMLDDTSRLCTHIMSITVSVLVIIVSTSKVREAKSRHEVAMVKQMLYTDHKQYLQNKATTDIINIKCHDLRNQIALLGERMDQQELIEINKAIEIYDASAKTGNTALDVVLSSKTLLCASKGVAFTCLADGKLLDFMTESDIYSLFSNIIDNGIEAAEKLSDAGKRILCLTVSAKNSFVLIHQENYYEGKLRFDGSLPRTTKVNREYHGFGLRSIKMLTDKYGGDMQIGTDNSVFILDIMLPLRTSSTPDSHN